MTYRQDFTLYTRKMPSGKKIFYYRFYDEDGNRSSGKSTGQATKSAARYYVQQLIKNGLLNKKAEIKFSKYCENWWIWDKCLYVKSRAAKGKNIGKSYVKICRLYLTKHILPYFKDYKLLSITPGRIEH